MSCTILFNIKQELAVVYWNQSLLQQSILCHLQANDLIHDQIVSLYRLFKCYSQLDDNMKTASILTQMIQINPHNKIVKIMNAYHGLLRYPNKTNKALFHLKNMDSDIDSTHGLNWLLGCQSILNGNEEDGYCYFDKEASSSESAFFSYLVQRKK